jgi:DnaJ-class molecular chaperone
MAIKRDYYEILGVDKKASADDINRTFKEGIKNINYRHTYPET